MEITGPNFKVLILEEAFKFMESLPMSAKKKIAYNIFQAACYLEPRFFKKLNQQIWEFRARSNGMQYRLLAFWDKKSEKLVIATHGFVKKTQKTPSNEIEHAKRIMERYYKEKS